MRILVWLCLLAATGAAMAENPAVERGAAIISEASLLETVAMLSAESMGGRLPGSPGYLAAARTMADRFAALGLQPAGDDGYFQHLEMEYNDIRVARLTLLPGGAAAQTCTLGDDFVCRGFTGSGDFTAEVVFCGYGLSLPERGYDDYAGVDVTGKVVLVYKEGPGWRLDDGDSWHGLHYPRPKARTAAEHGAVGVLLVSRPNENGGRPMVGSVLHGSGEQPSDMPQLHISPDAAATLLATRGLDLAELTAQIDSTYTPASTGLDAQVEIVVDAAYDPAADVVNVVALLPGSDADLADEFLVLGAHLDHVGRQADLLFPGANDNASGSAAVYEIARAFVESGVQPRRSIVFILFAGEEQGLHGARHYADCPRRPLAKTVAMFNFDCVAHGDSLRLGNGKSAPGLWNLARDLDREGDHLTTSRTWGGGGADAGPFHDRCVPCLYFVTKNSYTHLHRPSDTVETLNGPLFEALVRLGFRTAAAVADGSYQREVIDKDS